MSNDEVCYSVPESLMRHIYLALFNRQMAVKGGMMISTKTDFEVTHCIAELDKKWQFKEKFVSGEQKFIDTRSMADVSEET